MRACHVVYGYFPADPRVKREVDTLVRQGHEVSVIALRDSGEAGMIKTESVTLRRLPLRIRRGSRARYLYQYVLFFLEAAALLGRLHRQHRFDIIHVHSLPDFLVFVAFMPKLTGARVVLDLHEAMPEILSARFGGGTRAPLVMAGLILERVSCRFADRVIVVNDAIRRLLASRGTPLEKMTVIMNASDLDLPLARPSRLEGELKAAGKQAIVYVGGINPERDLEVLVHAMSIVRARHNVVLWLIGRGEEPYLKRLQELAQREGFQGDFRIGPWMQRDEVLPMLALSEIGPITYEYNPLTRLAVPNKIFEYAAAEKPLVVADLPTVHTLLGDSALYYRPGDPDDLARCIVELLEDPPLRRRLAQAGRQVLSQYSWTVMAERLRQVYAQLTPARG